MTHQPSSPATEVLDFLNSIEGAGYGGMASFEIARAHVQDMAAQSCSAGIGGALRALEQIAIVCTKNMDRDCNHRMALDGVRQIANDFLNDFVSRDPAQPSADIGDLVERLRNWPATALWKDAFSSTFVGALLNEAADAIERSNAPAQGSSVREAALEKAARDFIAKVDRGDARSFRSYVAFKEALALPSPERQS